ncbi:MAG: DTW domain-containing protein [Candidatus Brocadiae bacterium]|nr:DTW domain-containing protein [Candidatus Brocadiia bacterium]
MKPRTRPPLKPGEAPPGLCPGCWLAHAACLCREAPFVRTRTRFVVIRHDHESRRRTNSGRLVPLALANAEIVSIGGPSDPPTRVAPGPGVNWLLYPDGTPAPPGPPPDRVYVLDGTWSQARRIFLRNPALQRLPRLSLAPEFPAVARLRRELVPERMATLEAVARAVDLLEGPRAGNTVMDYFDEFVRRNVASAAAAGRRIGTPAGPGRTR